MSRGAPPEPYGRVLLLRHDEKDPFRRAWRTIDVIEWAVKWEVAVVLGLLLDTREVPADLRLRLSASLARPSLGAWVEFLRRGLGAMPSSKFAEWDVALRLEDRFRFVNFRNDYAHGAVENDPQARERCSTFEPVIEQLSATPFLTETALLVVREGVTQELGGPEVRSGRDGLTDGLADGTYAWIRPMDTMVSLWPFAAVLPKVGDRPEGLYFHNALRQHRVESLNYEIPARRREADLYGPFIERVPLSDWQREGHADRLESLALREDLQGRESLLVELLERVTTSPECVLLGPPGQGKSSVMAALEHRLGSQPDAPRLLAKFLRRGDLRSEPQEVLRSLNVSLADILGFSIGAEPPKTLAAAAEVLQLLLDRWHNVGRGPLVLLLDGIDEQPELIGALPRVAADIHLVWAARPTEAVRTSLVSRGVPQSRVTALGPLSLNDARAILYRGVDKLDERLDGRYVSAVLERSDGNPLFLVTLSEYLFDNPHLVGDVSVIPPDLSRLFEHAVTRSVEREDPTPTLMVLRLLAVALDRLTTQEIAALLEIDTYAASRALRALDELCISSSDGRQSWFALFHDTLREWVQDNHRRESFRIHEDLASRAGHADPGSDAQAYLIRHGAEHAAVVVSGGSTRAREIVLGLEERLASDAGSFSRQLGAHGTVERFAAVWELTEDIGSPSSRLAPLLLDLARGTTAAVSEHAIHDVLTYRRRRGFTDGVYVAIEDAWSEDDPDRVRMGVLAAGRLRRKGSDDDRKRSKRLLRPFREARTVVDELHPSLHGRARYEIGYLHHLEDDPDGAVLWLDRASEAARQGGDRTREWSSRCVSVRIQWLAGRASPEKFLETLAAADEAFAEAFDLDPAAVRWRMNVTAHRLEVELQRGNVEQAAPLLDLLEADPWIVSFGYVDTVQVDRDRLAVLCGDAGSVVERVVARAERRHEEEPHSESLADYDLYAASALHAVGDRDGARRAAVRGLSVGRGQAAWYARPELERFLGL